MNIKTASRTSRPTATPMWLLAVIVGSAAAAGVAPAQEDPPKPSRQELAADTKLFLTLASKALKWEEPTDPVRIAGPVYFVGTKGLGSYLIATADGHVLLNTGMPSSAQMIAASVKKLGFDPKDIKLLIAGHPHIDHVGALADLKEQTGAKVAIMREDVQAITDGGKDDFHYGGDWKVMGFRQCKVDRVLRDEDTIKMGDVVLTAYHTPGHTRGATTWVASIVDDGKPLVVAWPDGGGVNPGYRLVKNPSYPGIDRDYRRTFDRWERLKPDVFLAPHTEAFGFAEKRKRAARDGVAAWVDPEGYRRWVATKKREFEELVELETAPAGGERK
ncbi:MAG: subclass B3 metallo-beta-lactamase [Gemmataceae bacterium]|nr:subclass B3 metallo-beta-lactamase [Gemmataceae bacterium]